METTKSSSDSEAVRERDAAQAQEEEAHRGGHLMDELGGFAKEVMEDIRQFPQDVVLDGKDPDRRAGEQQGSSSPSAPAAEPAP